MPLGLSRSCINNEKVGNIIPTLPLGSLKAIDPFVGTPIIWVNPAGDPNGASTFAGLSYQKIGISQWIKNLTNQEIFEGGNGLILFSANSTDITHFSAWTTAGYITQTATGLSLTDGNWHHIYLKIDSTQILESDRAKLYCDGIEVSTYTGGNSCSLNDTLNIAAGAAWENARVIAVINAGDVNQRNYQYTIFSGTLPDIADLYNAGKAKDISALPGLYSWLDFTDGIVLNDSVLSLTWEEETPDQWEIDEADAPI